MSNESNSELSASEDDSQHKDKRYTYFVDGEPYHTESRYLTGAQIKAQIPDFNPAYQLVREGLNGQPDHVVADQETIDLDVHPPIQFYVAPPATFGS